MSTVVALFDTVGAAQKAVEALQRNGVANEHIGLVTQSADGGIATSSPSENAATATGLVSGGLLGGLTGLLVGTGALLIPGIGPIVAAGPLVAALTGAGIGAAAGGFAGALVDLGVPAEEAEIYQRGLERGGVLVTAQVADDQAAATGELFRANGARDIQSDAVSLYGDPTFRYGGGS